jgi:hypothetical protein
MNVGPTQRTQDERHEERGFEGFGEERGVAYGAGPQPRLRHARVGTQKNARNAGFEPLGAREELDAIHRSHVVVGDDEVEGLRFQQIHRFVPGLREPHARLGPIAYDFHEQGQRFQHVLVVVDDEDPFGVRRGQGARRVRARRPRLHDCRGRSSRNGGLRDGHVRTTPEGGGPSFDTDRGYL